MTGSTILQAAAATGARLASAACAILVLAASGGCTPWPAEGTGGLAERHPTSSVALVMLENRYRNVLEKGAERHAASRTVDARLLLTKARREIAADLGDDAEVTLTAADSAISDIERNLARHVRAVRTPNHERAR